MHYHLFLLIISTFNNPYWFAELYMEDPACRLLFLECFKFYFYFYFYFCKYITIFFPITVMWQDPNKIHCTVPMSLPSRPLTIKVWFKQVARVSSSSGGLVSEGMHDSPWSTKTWQRGWNLVKILESVLSFLNRTHLCAWMPHCQMQRIEPKLSGSPTVTSRNNMSLMGCSGSHSEFSTWVCFVSCE